MKRSLLATLAVFTIAMGLSFGEEAAAAPAKDATVKSDTATVKKTKKHGKKAKKAKAEATAPAAAK